jgi:hypothetical protein
MGKITSFCDLDAWKEGHRLVLMVYRTLQSEKVKCLPNGLVQLGAYNCTVIVGFNAQLLKYFAVLHPLTVWHNRQSILAQLTSYLSREILVHQGGNEPIVNPAPRGLPNPRLRRKRPGFANPWRANNYALIYAEMHLS